MPRALRPEVTLDTSGLPRPSPVIVSRRELRRRFLLKQTADLEVRSLPLSLQHLLLGPRRVLSDQERRRLAAALVARQVDARRLGVVLNLVGDAPISDTGLAELVAAAEQQRERDLRPGDNFSILGLEVEEQGGRHARGWTPYFVVRLRADGPPQRELRVVFDTRSLCTTAQFRSVCLRQAHFLPVWKEHITPQRFQRVIAALIDQVEEHQHA
jgi:hypothetical protein